MVTLFHGPSSRGSLPPSCSHHEVDGVDSLRFFVSEVRSPTVGGGNQNYSLGPLDQAGGKYLDVLLKTIEEPPSYSNIFLWCFSINSVPPTLVSRCQVVWCPGAESIENSDYSDKIALAKTVPDLILACTAKDIDLRDACEGALRKKPSLWRYIRPLFKQETILPSELVISLIPSLTDEK